MELNNYRKNTVISRSSNIALYIYIHSGIIWDMLRIVKRVSNKLLKILFSDLF